MNKKYKTLRLVDGEIESIIGNHIWEVGKTYSVRGRIKLCKNGFHCTSTPAEAMYYGLGNVIAIVEGYGKCIEGDFDMVYQSMKIVKAYKLNSGRDTEDIEDMQRIYEYLTFSYHPLPDKHHLKKINKWILKRMKHNLKEIK